MSFNASLVNTYFEKTFILDTGVATRVWTFKSPTFPTVLISMDCSADACDSTDKPTMVFAVAGDTRVTGTAISTADAVTSFTTADTNKSLVVAPDQSCTITLTCAGTAGNVRGIVCSLKFQASSVYPAAS